MKCIVCDNSCRFRVFLREKRHHPKYWKCKECGLVFAYPQASIDYENYEYTCCTKSEIDARFLNYEIRYQVMRPYLDERKHVLLDIGAGNGAFLSYVKEKGVECIGVEPNWSAGSYGKKNLDVKIVPVAFEEYEVDDKVNIVTMFNVLEHVVDPIRVITKIRQILKKKGLLVIEVPNIFTPQGLLSHGYWYVFDRGHNWFFNKKTAERFLGNYGFKVKEQQYVGKVVTLAKVFDGVLSVAKVYRNVSRRKYLEFRESKFYKMLNSKYIRVNMIDYLLVVCEME